VDFIALMPVERRMWVYAKEKKRMEKGREEKRRKGQGTTKKIAALATGLWLCNVERQM